MPLYACTALAFKDEARPGIGYNKLSSGYLFILNSRRESEKMSLVDFKPGFFSFKTEEPVLVKKKKKRHDSVSD